MSKYTSARELADLLNKISTYALNRDQRRTLGAFLAAEFGLEQSAEGEIHAFLVLVRLCSRLMDDIGALSHLDERQRMRVEGDATRITGKLIGVGQTFGLNVWKENFDPSFYSALDYIDLVLAGSVAYEVLDEQMESLSAQASEIIGAVQATDAHDRFKKVLVDRISQVKNAIEQYRIFGYEGIDEALRALCGEMALQTLRSEPIRDETTKRKVSTFLRDAMNFLSVARSSAEDITKIASIASDAYDKIGAVGG